MATIKLFIRPSTKKKDKPVNIYVRFKSGAKIDQTALSTLLVLKGNWSNETQTIRQRADIKNKDDFKRKLTNLKRFIEDEFNEVANKDALGKEWLKTTIDKFFNPDKYKESRITLFRFIEDFIEQSKERINPSSGKKISSSTLKKYGTCFNCLKHYSEYRKKEIDFDDVDLNFYTDFTRFLSKEKKHATNTIGKQIAVLKNFLNEATDRGLNNRYDFKSHKFKIITEESEAIYLNEVELKMLYKLDLSKNSRLERVRDLFLIGAHTGCRFSDYDAICKENIKDGYLRLEQIKTGNRVIIPVHPVVKSLLEKYEGKLPRVISNQKFNKYIKTVCEKAGINSNESKTITKAGRKETTKSQKFDLVSSHTARRSFATNLYKSGFPAISIMQITGHKSERAFLKYIKVTPEEHAEMLQEHWMKSSKAIIPNLKIDD